MGDWWQVVILGLVEGLTEFLPISSTGHLLIAARLLGFQHSLGGAFEVSIQLGAVLAVLAYYGRELAAQARSLPRSPATRGLWLNVALAFLPIMVVGLLLRTWIKAALFTSPAAIAWSLVIGGAVLIAVERLARRPPPTRAVTKTALRQALAIGLAQALALAPGSHAPVPRSSAACSPASTGRRRRRSRSTWRSRRSARPRSSSCG